MSTPRTRRASLPGTQIYRYQNIDFFVEDGLVWLVNNRPKEGENPEKCLTPSETRVRSLAFFNEAKRMQQSGGHKRDEIAAQLQLAVSLRDCARLAESQGDPIDPEIIAREVSARTQYHIMSANLGIPTASEIGSSGQPKKLIVPGEMS